MSRRNLVLGSLLVAAIVIGWWQLGRTGSTATANSAKAAAALTEGGQPLVFRDGRWVRVDSADVARLLHQLDNLAPGLLMVRGMVRNASDDRPMPGVEVVFAGPDGEASATTDDRGAYQIQLSAGFYRPFARGEGVLAVGPAIRERLPGPPDPGEVGVPRHMLAPVLGIFESHEAVDLEVQLGGTVVGTLVDEAGNPIPGAVVSAFALSGNQEVVRNIDGSDVAETDSRGQFRMAVPAGRVAFDIDHPQYAGLSGRSERMAWVEVAEPAEVRLIAAAGCVITGRVVDAEGKPVGPGSLELDIGGMPPNDFTPVGRIRDDGSFRFGTSDGSKIRMRAWPWKSPPSEPQAIDCAREGARPSVTFVIRPREPDVTGILLDADGEPVAGAYVDIIPDLATGMAQQERTDRQGRFAVYALPAGPYQIAAYVPDRGIRVSYIDAPARDVQLKLSATGSVRGNVPNVNEGRFTLSLGSCFAEDEDGASFAFDSYNMPGIDRIVPISGGNFKIEGLPPCTFYGRAVMGDKAMTVSVDVTPGGTTVVTWDFDQPIGQLDDDEMDIDFDYHDD